MVIWHVSCFPLPGMGYERRDMPAATGKFEEKGNGNAILVIDDERVLRMTFQHLLESEGYRVTTAGNGREGLEKFPEAKPDLVITDMVMPEMDGFETIESLRRLDPDLPIIAMSALIEEDKMERSIGAGTFCCVSKPVDQRTLFDLVRAILTPSPRGFDDFPGRPARV